MKKLLLSVLLLASAHGTTKSMNYTTPLTSALIGAMPATMYAAAYMVHGTDSFKERIKKSCKWILVGAAVGVYAEFIAPAPVCMGFISTACTEAAIWYSTKTFPVIASAATIAGFSHDIHNAEREDFLSIYN